VRAAASEALDHDLEFADLGLFSFELYQPGFSILSAVCCSGLQSLAFTAVLLQLHLLSRLGLRFNLQWKLAYLCTCSSCGAKVHWR